MSQRFREPTFSMALRESDAQFLFDVLNTLSCRDRVVITAPDRKNSVLLALDPNQRERAQRLFSRMDRMFLRRGYQI